VTRGFSETASPWSTSRLIREGSCGGHVV
jgi:hypothetical protein